MSLIWDLELNVQLKSACALETLFLYLTCRQPLKAAKLLIRSSSYRAAIEITYRSKLAMYTVLNFKIIKLINMP